MVRISHPPIYISLNQYGTYLNMILLSVSVLLWPNRYWYRWENHVSPISGIHRPSVHIDSMHISGHRYLCDYILLTFHPTITGHICNMGHICIYYPTCMGHIYPMGHWSSHIPSGSMGHIWSSYILPKLVWDISILWDTGALILQVVALICTNMIALEKQHFSLLVKTIYY